jgi:TonB family protein
MFRSLLVIVVAALSNLAAADLSGKWTGTIETNGSRVSIFVTLNQHDQEISGSVATGDEANAVPIEKAEVHDNQLAFELHNSTGQIVSFKLSLIGAQLSGEAATGDQLSKVVVSTVTPPVLILKIPPKYTEKARRAKVQGTVELYIQILPNGTATNIKVLRSLGFGLDERAVESVKKWKFKPGYKGNQPVTVEAHVEVNFRLLP